MVIHKIICIYYFTEELPDDQPDAQQDHTACTMSKQSTQTEDTMRLYSARKFDNVTIHFYTGLETYNKFCMVLQTLGSAVNSLNYYYKIVPQLSVEDQYF